MRVLPDQECAAVAGGHESECETTVKTVAIVAGAITGAVVGSSAGGVGAGPGAIVGGSAGGLVAEVVAPAICRKPEKKEEDGPSGNPFRAPEPVKTGLDGNSPIDSGVPLQLVVNTQG